MQTYSGCSYLNVLTALFRHDRTVTEGNLCVQHLAPGVREEVGSLWWVSWEDFLFSHSGHFPSLVSCEPPSKFFHQFNHQIITLHNCQYSTVHKCIVTKCYVVPLFNSYLLIFLFIYSSIQLAWIKPENRRRESALLTNTVVIQVFFYSLLDQSPLVKNPPNNLK